MRSRHASAIVTSGRDGVADTVTPQRQQGGIERGRPPSGRDASASILPIGVILAEEALPGDLKTALSQFQQPDNLLARGVKALLVSHPLSEKGYNHVPLARTGMARVESPQSPYPSFDDWVGNEQPRRQPLRAPKRKKAA